MKIKNLRKKIDQLDLQILRVLNQRLSLSRQIGKIKQKRGYRIYSPEREKTIYGKLLNKNRGPLGENALKAVYREIISASRKMTQYLKVAYLGPLATFTHLASIKKFGSSVEYVNCATITEIFNEVETGRTDYGVVPIENSIEGVVSHTLDMFIDSKLLICSEIYLEISHSFLSNSPKNKIKRIYSNPQVFGQCRIWLESNLPRAELIKTSSTTRAAQIAARQKNSAAIANILAAKKYKLKVLETSIEDSAQNVTRFLVIGKHMPKTTRNDKTSILLSIKDKVGALHDILGPFKRSRINLTKIESRPSKLKPWDYYFFVDFVGHCEQPKVKRALKSLEKSCLFLKVLGSYPAGDK